MDAARPFPPEVQRQLVEWLSLPWEADMELGRRGVVLAGGHAELLELAGRGDVLRLPPFEEVDFVLAPLFRVFKTPAPARPPV